VLGWAPFFGASVALPSLPTSPPGTPGPSGSTSGSFNGTYFGARIEKRNWSADALFMWQRSPVNVTNPLVKINLDFRIRAGVCRS